MMAENFRSRVLPLIAAATAASARAVAERARSLAPKSSGVLADSITAHDDGTISVDVAYALLVELDQPFLRPALMAEWSDFRARLLAAGGQP